MFSGQVITDENKMDPRRIRLQSIEHMPMSLDFNETMFKVFPEFSRGPESNLLHTVVVLCQMSLWGVEIYSICLRRIARGMGNLESEDKSWTCLRQLDLVSLLSSVNGPGYSLYDPAYWDRARGRHIKKDVHCNIQRSIFLFILEICVKRQD